MRDAQIALHKLGHDVTVPMGTDESIPVEARDDLSYEELITAKIEYDFIRMNFRKIEGANAILILNYLHKDIPGYIGGNTFLEMGYAFGLGKKVYLLNPVPEMDYKTEMYAIQPVVLNGDLTLIPS